jgi:putative transcriptional regulator
VLSQRYLSERVLAWTMADHSQSDADVLRSKRSATRYQILVQIAERQPAVSQQEIADEIGVTAQAVSDYLQGLVEEGFVVKEGRGRYEVTKEGVDWLIGQTDGLQEYVSHVSSEVIGQVEVETAVARTDVSEGETVSVTMRDGVLTAIAGDAGSATAVAVTDAAEGEDVGVTNFEGVVDYELGSVTVVSVPRVGDGGSRAVDPERVRALAAEHDLVATAGTEAYVAADRCDLAVDVRFGSAAAVQEAATKGLSVLVLAATNELSAHTDRLRDANISYEVVDPAD